MSLAAVFLGAVILLLLIPFLLLLPLFVGVVCSCFIVRYLVSFQILLLLIYCFMYMYLLLFVGVLCWSLFWYALLHVLSSFAINLARKRELVALHFCLLNVLLL